MAQKRIVLRKPSPQLDQRFTNIETQLKAIEDQMEYKFKAIEDQLVSKFQAALENYMNECKNNTHHFDRIYSELEEIKKNKKFNGLRLLSPKKKEKNDDVNSIKTTDGTQEDGGSKLAYLLQSPIIQSLRSLDFSEIAALLQNPIIQSLFADSKHNTNDKSRNKRKKRKMSAESSRLDLSLIGDLLQNPMVQSLLKVKRISS